MKVLDETGLQYLLTKLDDRYVTDISGKVDKVEGKGLSTNDYTTAEKNKLAGIASGAEVNVQADWSLANSSANDYIKNKPGSLSRNDVSLIYSSSSTTPRLISGSFLNLLLSIAYFDNADTLIDELAWNCHTNIIFDISGFENLHYPIYFYDAECVIFYRTPDGLITITCTYDVYYKIKNKQILQILLTDYLYNNYSYCFTCKTSFVKDAVSALGLVKGEDNLLYQIHPENGDVTPLSHPDLSTLPSILPLRFGKYDIKEVLVPIRDSSTGEGYAKIDNGSLLIKFCDLVPKDILIIEASVFGDGVLSPATIIRYTDHWCVYINIPFENYKNKLDYVLVRYASAKDNYYYYSQI